MDYLATNRIFIRPHNWSTNKIKAIGFLVDYNPGHMCREDEKPALDQTLKFICKDTKVHDFQLITTQKGFGNDAQRITTQVAEVQCAQPDAESLKKIFTSQQYTVRCIYRFIPEGILQVHGMTLYKNILVAHNRFMNRQKTIPVENLMEEALFVLANDDSSTGEVLLKEGNNGHMKEAKLLIHRTSTKGRWLVACAATHIEKTRTHISYILNSVLPMLVKTNGRNDTARFFFDNNPPNIVGRPILGTEMSAFFENIATTFANPQADETDDILDDNDREAQAYKKRCTGVQSYAEIAQKAKAETMTTKPPAQTDALAIRTAKSAVAAELANISSKFDDLAKTVMAQGKSMDKRLEEQADDINLKLHLLADEQEEKMSMNFERFEKIAISFAQRGDELGKNLNEYVNNTFAAMVTQNELKLKQSEEKTMKAFTELCNELFRRARNRMEIDTTVNNSTPQPAVTPGPADTDTPMSVCGAEEGVIKIKDQQKEKKNQKITHKHEDQHHLQAKIRSMAPQQPPPPKQTGHQNITPPSST